jgi:hypothetical protein
MLFFCFLAIPRLAHSVPITITNSHSSMTVDGETQDGISDWSVGGNDHMKKQWHWYWVTGDSQETSLDKLQFNEPPVVDEDDFGNPSINFRYGARRNQ